MKDKVKALWKLCFDDSESFVEMYFRLRYSNEVNIAIQSGEEVIAALQMIPYSMTFCGKLIQTAYTSGACTHPDYRGHGVMRELLSQAFVQMAQNNTSLSTLIPAEPWLFDYYSRMGYAPVFKYSIEQLTFNPPRDTGRISVQIVSHYNEAIYQYLNHKLMERSCCIQHSADDFNVVLADAAISDGTLYIASIQNTIVGIAFVYIREDGLYIDELHADNKEVRAEILNQIKRDNNAARLQCIVPPIPDANQVTLGMGRIIDAKKIMKLYAANFPEKEMSFTLIDEQLTANTGYYHLYNGECIHSDVRSSKTNLNLTIGQLGEMILSPLQPYMSLMLN